MEIHIKRLVDQLFLDYPNAQYVLVNNEAYLRHPINIYQPTDEEIEKGWQAVQKQLTQNND